MKRHNKILIMQLIIVVVTVASCIGLFYLIWNSDMPMWLKWMMLR